MVLSERYLSLQGEGHLSGVPMYFVRAQGCSVKCPIRRECDQPESLKMKGGDHLSSEQIVEEAFSAVGNGWICLTGGEPMNQAPSVGEVILLAQKRGMKVNVQTSGAIDGAAMSHADFVTVSPKQRATELKVKQGHELKLVYTGQDYAQLRACYSFTKFHHYFLQPLWINGESNIAETIATVQHANQMGMPFRLSMQTHKHAGIR